VKEGRKGGSGELKEGRKIDFAVRGGEEIDGK
jgi:hypothetical protein